MSNEAPFDGHSQESLKAIERLAAVIPLCSDAWPCSRTKCKRCKKRAAWQRSMEITDLEWENQIWGAE